MSKDYGITNVSNNVNHKVSFLSSFFSLQNLYLRLTITSRYSNVKHIFIRQDGQIRDFAARATAIGGEI